MTTKIEWAEESWNPISGCTPISPGCANCWAKRMSKRLAGRFGYPADEPFRVTFHPDKLDQPLHWKKPRRIFVCSMSDPFHRDVSEKWLWQIFKTMAAAYWHTYMILTKRPDRMLDFYQSKWYRDMMSIYGLQNVWAGVTAENQAMADERIPILLKIPAAVHYVSIEPMLTPVNLEKWLWEWRPVGFGPDPDDWDYDVFPKDGGIDLVIAGAESGPKRRPANMEWFRDLRDQSQVGETAFFLKQMDVDEKLIKMPNLDGKIWNEMPDES